MLTPPVNANAFARSCVGYGRRPTTLRTSPTTEPRYLLGACVVHKTVRAIIFSLFLRRAFLCSFLRCLRDAELVLIVALPTNLSWPGVIRIMQKTGAIVAAGAAFGLAFLYFRRRKQQQQQPPPPYPIGTLGVPWGAAERKAWFTTRSIKRSYRDEVLAKLFSLPDCFSLEQYGSLSCSPDNSKRYPLYAVRTRQWSGRKPCVLITGGVHGYETSGVQGALLFLQEHATTYSQHFNLVVAPCVAPWGYETINRWNAEAVDPNRSFNPHGPRVEGRPFNPEAATEESTSLIAFLNSLCVDQWL